MTDALTRRTLAAGLLFLSGGAAEPAPHRVVSIGSCLDPILLALADPGQIAALSHFARDPLTSTVTEQARRFAVTHEGAEEVVALDPDLILASKRSGLYARTALKARGLRVEEFDMPNTVEASLQQVRKIAALVGRPDRGEALILRMETALAAVAPKPGEPRLRALVYQSGGLAAGPATLLGEMLERCGFENGAARYGLRKWGSVSLERVLADPPQVLLAGARAEGAPTWADRVIDHPALESLRPRTFRAGFPQKLIYCGGPVLIETAKVLAKARRRAEAWARQRSLRD
ncbi:ABC transporter substrate-binding protein [Caulobacter sp. RL271]|uniref:ABC transporter substrate-binding protein n=1 Tax=Caulobacter segnis TaxID=88688 RepID=A0ABY4ZYW9_9CAUL|nr:ABC transporter substrate-binding protein [Caulobacter segnis]USQ98002.1 ABC transporter substrate-binding protein [Caulobacter segnis]